MFEIVVLVTFIASGDAAEYVYERCFDTKAECEITLPLAYEQLRLSVLRHVVEQISVDRECRLAQKGA